MRRDRIYGNGYHCLLSLVFKWGKHKTASKFCYPGPIYKNKNALLTQWPRPAEVNLGCHLANLNSEPFGIPLIVNHL